MTKVMKTVFLVCAVALGGMAVAGDSFVGYDSQGNQVHVVNGQIVSTVPRAVTQYHSYVPAQPYYAPAQPYYYESYPQPRAYGRTTGSGVRLHSGMGHGPSGRLERMPYDPAKWYKDEVGMIDQINRDYPPVYPRNRGW